MKVPLTFNRLFTFNGITVDQLAPSGPFIHANSHWAQILRDIRRIFLRPAGLTWHDEDNNLLMLTALANVINKKCKAPSVEIHKYAYKDALTYWMAGSCPLSFWDPFEGALYNETSFGQFSFHLLTPPVNPVNYELERHPFDEVDMQLNADTVYRRIQLITRGVAPAHEILATYRKHRRW